MPFPFQSIPQKIQGLFGNKHALNKHPELPPNKFRKHTDHWGKSDSLSNSPTDGLNSIVSESTTESDVVTKKPSQVCVHNVTGNPSTSQDSTPSPSGQNQPSNSRGNTNQPHGDGSTSSTSNRSDISDPGEYIPETQDIWLYKAPPKHPMSNVMLSADCDSITLTSGDFDVLPKLLFQPDSQVFINSQTQRFRRNDSTRFKIPTNENFYPMRSGVPCKHVTLEQYKNWTMCAIQNGPVRYYCDIYFVNEEHIPHNRYSLKRSFPQSGVDNVVSCVSAIITNAFIDPFIFKSRHTFFPSSIQCGC